MPYAYAADSEEKLLLIRFRGTVTGAEERDVLRETAEDDAFRPGMRVLVDRRDCVMDVSQEDIAAQVQVVEQVSGIMGHPRVAQVAPSDHSFGVLRQFELVTDARGDRTMRVFRELEPAIKWLGVPAELIGRLEAELDATAEL